MCLVCGSIMFWNFFNTELVNCLGKIQVILRRTYESAVVPKRTFYSSGPFVGRCSKSTAAAWARITAQCTRAGFAAEEALGG